MIIYIYEEKELADAVSYISECYSDTKIFLLQGTLGAGKTTFVKAFCSLHNVVDETSSPTFSIVNEYEMSDRSIIAHMDLYRLNDIEELIDVGFDDYLDRSRYTFIEWPEYALNLIEEYVDIHITILGDEIRKIECSSYRKSS